MCRSTTIAGDLLASRHSKDRDRFRIRAFYLRLSVSEGAASARAVRRLPEALTLVYLPRIDGSPLEVNGAKIHPDVPAFAALHRIRSAETGRSPREALFASTDRVRAGEGARFEAYVGAEKLFKGVVRRRGEGWAVECRCAAECDPVDMGVSAAEVRLADERGVVIEDRVEMATVRGRGRRRSRRRFCLKLEEIPEESEGCDCCCCSDGEDDEDEWEMAGSDCVDAAEMEMDGVRWAVDVGIWGVCLGVGLLVSRAFYKGLRRI